MKQNRVWIIGLVILIGVWILAWGVMRFARGQKMTAEKVVSYVSLHPLNSRSDAERMKTIEEMARLANQLSIEERQKFRFEKEIRSAYKEMNDAEKARYLDLTLPGGMKQMMEAFNKMTPAKRKQLINRAMNDLTRLQSEGNREEFEKTINDENMKRIIDEGMKTYLSEANAASKLEIQPLLEQMQAMMQGIQ
jgi:hypothetical protein